ncbi:hypothetical protein HYFRA_00012768 [Hymenoscyphus fraxineus]|uniref:Uncharacterized protein n=1 Tax=Hymenoscyphus fraxineus TaxID=746836 RepID=A0A9N9PYQ8_9HELO|nr:hypothetical protein HYFRA_00012768 [Hymenoscyphus fraxineus]
MATLSPSQLLQELQPLASTPPEIDETLRTKLAVAARSAFLSLQKPEDVVARQLEGITVRIAIDLKLFSILKDGEKTFDQVVEATKASPVLLGRSRVFL